MTAPASPVLVFSQGDPAGIGPEILLACLASAAHPGSSGSRFRPLLVAERAALEALRGIDRRPLAARPPAELFDRLVYLERVESRADLPTDDRIAVLDPVAEARPIELGRPGPADAAGAVAALDAAAALAEAGIADALVTAPVSKEVIARHHLPGFVGHTDYLARRAGLEHYGRDYLMAFLAADLKVALLSTHVPLARALELVTRDAVVDALACLDRHAARGGRIAVAGLNPHAGEGGLLGDEDAKELVPAVAAARRRGIDARGPESADSLFARARRGEFDWVLALYHDQGLIAVKTAAFGSATNWTVGLPYLRTSVDHGTAYHLAGRGEADAAPLAHVVETTLALLGGAQRVRNPD